MEKKESKEIALVDSGFAMNPKNMDEAMKFCELISKSDLVPKDFAGKPGNVLVAIQMGNDIGLKPMQALQSIAVINGRPSIWGDAVMAIVRASGTAEYIEETWDDKTQAATCRAKRKGDPKEIVRVFSMEDAKKAGLAGKAGTWQNYPKRMCQMRARSWVLRDGWADYLKGISIAEEAQDIVDPRPEIIMPKAIQAEVVSTPQPEQPVNKTEVSPPAPEPVAAPVTTVSDEPKKITATVNRLTKNKLKSRTGVERERVLMHCVSEGKECFFGIFDNDELTKEVKDSVNAGAPTMDITYKETAEWANEVINIEAQF